MTDSDPLQGKEVAKTRYRIKISYDGTNYHGFQLQSQLVAMQGRVFPTVQSEVERAIARVQHCRPFLFCCYNYYPSEH